MSNSGLRRRAAARSMPSRSMARLINSAMPVAAEPAPRNRKRCSESFFPVRRKGAVDAGQRDAGGALDVVVEGADLVAIARQDRDSVEISKILPLDAAFRVELLHSHHELVYKGEILFAAHAVLAQALIERVIEQNLIVRADVENDRQTVPRRHAGARGIERELADRDAHPAGAEVAETEDALAVGDHDEAHILFGPIGE